MTRSGTTPTSDPESNMVSGVNRSLLLFDAASFPLRTRPRRDCSAVGARNIYRRTCKIDRSTCDTPGISANIEMRDGGGRCDEKMREQVKSTSQTSSTQSPMGITLEKAE